VFPCLANTIVVLPNAKLIFIFVKFEMAANTTSVKELNVLKQCCNPLNFSHIASSKKSLRPVLDWVMKKVSDIQKGRRICDRCRKIIANLPESFQNGADVHQA
jgi:hypothetical protein